MQEPRRLRTAPVSGRRVPEPVARRVPEPEGGGAARAAGVLCVLAVAAAVVLHGLTLATAQRPATRTLREVIPALTDLDQTLAAHAPDIAATAAGGANSVPLPGLPLTIEVPASAAHDGGDVVRRAAVDAIAARLYRDGHEAFRAPDAPPEGAIGLFSTQWAVRRALDALTGGAHDRFALGRTVAAAAAALLMALLVSQVDGSRRFTAVGSVLVIGGGLGVTAALLGQLFVWLFTAGDGGVAPAVVARVGHDLTMTVFGIGVTAAVTGGIVAAIGLAPWRAPGVRRARPDEGGPGPVVRPWEEW